MKATWIAVVFALGCGSTATNMPAPAPVVKATEAAPTPLGEVQIVNDELVLPARIGFDGDSATLTAESEPALRALHAYLEQRPTITLLRIEGHIGASGEAALMMSGERAFAIGGWLRDHGIDCKRLLAAAFGDTKPIVDPNTPDGPARNTRITLVPAELRGKAIGGMPVDGSASLSTDVCPE